MSKETKFTKGDWNILPIEFDKEYIRIRGTCAGGRYKIANVIDMKDHHDGSIWCKNDRSESLANAHLIKTAPKLYAEVESEIKFLTKLMTDNFTVNCSQSYEISKRIDSLGKALAEARGEL